MSETLCRRCRKSAPDVQLMTHATPDGYRTNGQPYWILDDERVIATVVMYHQRCIPPALFHKLAGSLPAEQSLPAPSPRKRHDVGEGMSRNRPRLPHRQRKKIAAIKKYEAEQAKAERQLARTMAMTITETIERGGKPQLCKCATFSRDSYFITPNGYCRYCGGWKPDVFRAHHGEDALQAAIDELDVYDRKRMRELVGAA